MYIVAILILALFVLGYVSHASKRRMREAVSNIGGPFCLPLIGAVHLAYGLNPQNVFEKAIEMGVTYGHIIKAWAFNRLVIGSGDPELNEQLLSSSTHITKHRLYGILHQWLGTGLLTSDGQKWHSRRKIITPTFHFKILEQFVEVFNQQSAILVDRLATRADGVTAFDVYPYVCAATLDIIAETAMGTKVKAQTDHKMQYTKAVDEMTSMIAWRFLRIHLHNDIVFSIMHPFKKLRSKRNLRIMHEFTHNVIKGRREALEDSLKRDSATNDSSEDHDDVGTKKRMALLDVLLQSTINGEPLTNEDIREEVDTFMFEGHDTTATALSCILHLLAKHPRVQNKALAEIRRVYGDDYSRPCTLTSLNELKYLECVIKEGLRLFPPVPIIAREIKEDFKYKHSTRGDGVIPAGSEFFIVIFAMSVDITVFKYAAEFLPERHEENNGKSNFQFIPFSAGPRNCIGQKFAMNEMKVSLTQIIRAFELLPLGKPIEPVMGIVLRSATGMQLGLRKRTN